MDEGRNPEDLLNTISELFRNAEIEIKLAEQMSGNIIIPAINELRYAGNHLLKGLLASSPKEQREQYFRALRHCQRAHYDAVEAVLLYLLDKFRTFQNDYEEVSIPAVWPDYAKHLSRFHEAHSLLKSVVKNPEDIDDLKDNREKLLGPTKEACNKLAPIVALSDSVRIELNKQIDTKRTSDLYARWTIALALISILVTLLAR
ncbi:MAG: hypothetical protein HQL76_08830 [Magnetococcales bacterium]|nr:hypothetical protein [Magnetococcales bacterium]